MVTVMEILVRPMRAVPPGHHTVLAFLRTHPNLTCVPVDLQVAQDAAHLRADRKLATLSARISVVRTSARISAVRMSAHLPFP